MIAISESKFRLLLNIAQAQGWKVEMTPNCHWKLIPPQGRGTPVFVATTPGDHRWLENTIRNMRQRGFVMPRKGGH